MYFGQTLSVQQYDRKIKYLDYMENGVRVRGVGFVKLERRNGSCTIGMQINGLYRRDRFTRPLFLLDGAEERELCKLQLADGGIRIQIEKPDSRDLDGNGLSYEQVIGLRIPISEGKEIRCLWGEQRALREEKEEAKAEMTPGSEAEPGTAREAEQAMPEGGETALGTEMMPGSGTAREAEQAVPENGEVASELAREAEQAVPEDGETAPEAKPAMEGAAAAPIIHEDKWTQLWVIYPHIKPFHDEREYLSMGPGDFVILPGRYYRLVNNSFLLHGYYNYRHLIMTRIGQRNNVKYYIGVPGNYYEREKKIAVMFGFESFECGMEPAEEGDFGYYMIPVEL